MNIDATTVTILKNFSTINPSIFVKPGNKLRTISANKTIMAEATVDANFESQFGIYDLNQFLSVLSLFENPELTFEESSVTIGSGKSSVRYFFADENMITTPPDKELTLPDSAVDFVLSAEDLKKLTSAASVLQAPHFVVEGNGGTLRAFVADTKNKTSNEFSVELGEAKADSKHVFRVENLKLLTKTYKVAVAKAGLAEFQTEDGNLKYFVPAESV